MVMQVREIQILTQYFSMVVDTKSDVGSGGKWGRLSRFLGDKVCVF